MEITSSDLTKRLWPFLLVMLAFWVVSVILLSQLGYYGTFAEINEHHLPFFDTAALYFLTHLGDGVILPLTLLLFIWKKDPGLAISAIIAVLFTGLFVQVLKGFIFDDWHRPPKVFEGVTGVDIFHPDPPRHHSFPSGHSTSYAAGGVFFAWFLNNWHRGLPLLVGLLTVMLCYTRVAIGVHFPGDIFVGSVIGTMGGILVLFIGYPIVRRRIETASEDRMKRLTRLFYILAPLAIVAQFIHLILTT